jgi:protein-disulfide isomerase
MHNDNGGMKLSPKASFALGMAGGVLVLCTIGFFILLGMVLDGKKGADVGPAVDAGPQPSAQVPTNTAPEPEGPTVGQITPVSEDDNVLGNEDAAVTLMVYTDFECPYCGRFHPSVEQAIEDFGDDVRVVIRNFPLSFHQKAVPAANAAECAGEQGEYFEYVSELFANQTKLGDDLYEEIASDLGLSMSSFRTCLEEDRYEGKISADLSSGMAAGVTGTPGTLIISEGSEPQLVPGAVPYAQFKAMIEAAL